MVKIKNDAFLSIFSMQPGRTPANTIEPQPSDAVSTLVLLVVEQPLERSSFIVIREAQPTLESECPHNFLHKKCLRMQVCLRAAQHNVKVVFQRNRQLVECALEVVSVNIRRDMRQVVQHTCEQHLIEPRVDSISLRKIGSRRRFEGTGLKDLTKNALRSRLHNPIILPTMVMVYEGCILVNSRSGVLVVGLLGVRGSSG